MPWELKYTDSGEREHRVYADAQQRRWIQYEHHHSRQPTEVGKQEWVNKKRTGGNADDPSLLRQHLAYSKWQFKLRSGTFVDRERGDAPAGDTRSRTTDPKTTVNRSQADLIQPIECWKVLQHKPFSYSVESISLTLPLNRIGVSEDL